MRGAGTGQAALASGQGIAGASTGGAMARRARICAAATAAPPASARKGGDRAAAAPAMAALAGTLLGPGVAVAGTDPADLAHERELYSSERIASASAVPKRRHEFAAGRVAARRALAALGHPPAALPRGADRAPVWPEGITGSLSHGGGLCLAAVAPRVATAALGIDIEPDRPLDPALCDTVLTTRERAALAGLPADLAGRRALAAFSAKEALFKAQFPISGALLDFAAVEIFLGPEEDPRSTGHFQALFQQDAGPFGRGDRLPGRIARRDGVVLTTVRISMGSLVWSCPIHETET